MVFVVDDHRTVGTDSSRVKHRLVGLVDIQNKVVIVTPVHKPLIFHKIVRWVVVLL